MKKILFLLLACNLCAQAQTIDSLWRVCKTIRFMRYVLLTIVYSLMSLVIIAQNLVVDSSFNYFPKSKIIPNMPYQIENEINYWKKGGSFENTPDFYKYLNLKNVTSSYGDTLLPKTGLSYVFLGFREQGFGECIETELTSAFKAKEYYKISFYVSRSRHSYVRYVKTIPVAFMPKKYRTKQIMHTLQLTNLDDSLALMKRGVWVYCSQVYKAKGGEKWLMLGSPKKNYYNNTRLFKEQLVQKKWWKKEKYKEPSSDRAACYYIDDVSVILVDSLGNAITQYSAVTSNTSVIEFNTLSTNTTYRLGKLLFKVKSSVIDTISYTELTLLVGYLQAHSSLTIAISGHTDDVGKEESNQLLSTARAQAVANYLIQHGILATRISCKGYGSSQPLQSNTTDEGRAQNRRVEFIIK